MKYLFIAEKPSLMQSVKECYENHRSEIMQRVGQIDFIALAGHVCANYEPNDYEEWNVGWSEIEYPMIPEMWGLKVINDKRKKEIVDRIDKIARSYDGIIVGTDSDTEGYGIYFNLEHYLGIDDMPALRFIEHSLTDQEIRESLLSMTDYHNDELHVRFQNSYMIRSYSDWLYGMNATRLMSVKLNQLMTIGRVKAPTIRLVYDNSMAIENFTQRKFYVIEADYENFRGILCSPEGKRWETDNKAVAESCAKMISLDGRVIGKQQKDKVTHAPKLYDLTSIQADAGAKYGYTPTKTLEIIQSLYEKHKVISYPRTQCRYVSSEKAKEFPKMLQKMHVFNELAPYADIDAGRIESVMHDKNVVNDVEVAKESHDALLPTQTTPDLSKMTQEEINVCLMIYKRLLAQFLPAVKEKKTQLLIQHGVSGTNGSQALFITEGKVVINPGWSVLYSDLSETLLPDLNTGDSVYAGKFETVEKKTAPPKRLTQHSLIAAMKNIASLITDKELKKSLADSQGIGTPATRANIIDDIIKRGYVRDNKGLYITELGKTYIEALENVDIVKPEFAAVIDTKIKKIQRGEEDYVEVYNDVIDGLYNVCEQISLIKPKRVYIQEKCPKCGSVVASGAYNYECSNEKCDFEFPKKIAGVDITEEQRRLLFSGEKTGKMKFKKKDGATFEARLRMNPQTFKAEFDFSSGLICPYCQKDVRANRGGWFCDCGLKVYKQMSGRTFKESEVKKLLEKKRVNKLTGFMKKDGNYFSHPTDVYLDDMTKTVKFWFGGQMS